MAARVISWLAVGSSAVAVAFTWWTWFPPDDAHVSMGHHSGAALGWGLLGTGWAVIGALVVGSRPRNPLGWILLGIGVSQAWHVGLVAYAICGLTVVVPSWPAALWAGYAGSVLFVVGVLVTPTVLLALYPDGRLDAWWSRLAVLGAVVAVAHIAAGGLFLTIGGSDGTQVVVVVPDYLQGVPTQLLPPASRHLQPVWTTDQPLPGWLDGFRDRYLPATAPAWVPLFLLSMLVIWAGTTVRLVRARSPRRQQLALVVCVVMPFLIASWLAPVWGRPLALVTLLLVPVAVAVGVLRYRLLGIQAVLRRGLVYGVLTAVVAGLYFAVTAVAGTALDRRPLPGILAAVLVAVGLAPFRDRLQLAVDRLVYGERRDPLRAITRLGRQVAVVGEGDLLPAALASLSAAVRAPGAAVTDVDGEVLAAVGDDPGDAPTVVPLDVGGRRIGHLHLAPPGPGERYTDPERRLVRAMAAPVAVLVRAVELTRELEVERDRVVGATRVERERLRRDLHDGLGPSLSGVGLGLQALIDRTDPADAAATVLLDRIQAEITSSVGEVRRIIDNLRPVALDALGLAAAIRTHAATVSAALPVDVHAGPMPAVAPEVETSAYRITTEAVTNAARHAAATRVRVSLTAPNGTLRITVADDGIGVGNAVAGVGLTSMRRRAETLGGHLDIASSTAGTVVTATLPLEQP
jgi:signal transduction histidine kinase